ncbi:eukaryotic translation initiation factor 2-alpha kinase [Entomophthora muscae]|uniref:Eukaryotic translation initiation factor 2-alpha kinase n=1 Tax=Entomophthora muscae TaxID=34485 RepID=A0ACC2RZT2_9FUNG|nr:eukaryotic translation initiation factor 2-alpha kinase [Entomophthora muscae]
MRAKMPISYPKIPPEITLEAGKGITERQLEELKLVVKKRTISAVGSEMIFDLVDLISDYITAHHAGTEKSSFHEQMMKRQEQLIKEKQERALEERERNLLLEKERERLEQLTLSLALEEEMIKKEKRLEDERRKRKLIRSNLSMGSVLEFDSPINLPKQDSPSQKVSFQAVYLSYCLHEEPTKIYLVTPYESKQLSLKDIPPLTIEEIIILPTQNNKLLAIQELREIEESLETLKIIKHPGLLRLFAFKVETVEKDSSWRLFVLTETRLNSPTFRSVLKQGGGAGTIKKYFKELLKAVLMLHNNRLVYNCIRSDHIFVESGDSSAEDCAKTIFDQATSFIKLKPKSYVQKSSQTERSSRIDLGWYCLYFMLLTVEGALLNSQPRELSLSKVRFLVLLSKEAKQMSGILGLCL